MELLGKYTAKLLYGWDDRRFEEEYLNKLEVNWKNVRRGSHRGGSLQDGLGDE